MSKPWEETWHMTAMGGIGDAAGPPYGWIAGFVQAGESALRPTDADKARARLAAAAPDLARALLELEWTGPEANLRCSSCEASDIRGHYDECALAAALRKAGVIE